MQFLACLAFVCLVGASTVLQLNGTAYYSPDFSVGSLKVGKALEFTTVLPATYINKAPASAQDLKAELARLLNSDDVISEAFFSIIILPARAQVSKEIKRYLQSIGTTTFLSSKNEFPSGPYFLHPSGNLTQVYRLYVDTNMAFTQGVIEGEHGEYLPSVAAVGDSINAAVSIPVPSRHYYSKPSADKPLSGLRLGVKDLFNLKGIKTGGGSRAYFALYGPVTKTASSLQRLIDMGAVVIGKLKTSQFAIGANPTADYVDQLAPFNPRGDGYSTPGSSSCGPGAALASYDWLDLALASDTDGSIRGPSAANGVFGMRITNASLPLDGILPISPVMDTPGVMARDAKLLQTVYSNWFIPKANYSTFPKRIIMPDEFWAPLNTTMMPPYNKFIKDLSTLTGAKIEQINTNRSFIEHTGIKQGLDVTPTAAQAICVIDQWEKLGKPFISDYQKQFGGRSPFFDPILRLGLTFAPRLTSEDYAKAMGLVSIYREWFTSQLVTSCESSLVVYPLYPNLPPYRDNSLPKTQVSTLSISPAQQAALAGVPDYSVPIGIHKYKSAISMVEEEMPAAMGIIGGVGCDHMLLDLIVKLGEENEGFKTTVKTGRTMW